jgi:CDP-diacylglycerol--serine O-phosphatidyltransferase
MNLRFLPNLISLINLFIGCITVLLLIENMIELKYIFILSIICLILDFLDGFLARILNAKSELGLHLDSLADMVSFGLVPGVLIYNMLLEAPSSSVGSISSSLIPFTGFIVTLCSAYRLAKFNTTKINSRYFRGLPTPANTLLIFSFSIISSEKSLISVFILDYKFLIIITLFLCYLLISNIKLLSFKFINFNFNDNIERYLLILISLPMLLILKIYSIPIIILIYILTSIFVFKFKY